MMSWSSLHRYPSLSVSMLMLLAAEVSHPRRKHPLPARPLLWGRSAAGRLHSHLPCEKSRWEPLKQTICASPHGKGRRPQPTARPQGSRQTCAAPARENRKRLIIGPPGWPGAGQFGGDLQRSRGSQDVQERGVRGETERHGAGAGKGWGSESIFFVVISIKRAMCVP